MIKITLLAPSAIALTLMTALPSLAAELVTDNIHTLSTVLVTSSPEPDSLQDTPASISVIDEAELEQAGVNYLEDIVTKTPNVNLSAGASRGKYYQIRGIGERSQFTDTINPSVAVVVDGIDMSVMTLGAGLLDAKQVEVLRGPQGTRMGANGMADLINVQANEPTDTLEGNVELTVAQYNTQNLAGAIGGANQ